MARSNSLGRRCACRLVVLSAAAVSGGLLSRGSPARADSLSIADPVAVPGTVSLSTGTVDWSHYGTPGPDVSGGTGVTVDHPSATGFSALTAINGGVSGYAVTDSAPIFTWAGGTPDPIGSTRSWAFNNTTNFGSPGTGLSLTYNLAPGSAVLNLYVNNYTGVTNQALPVQLQATLASGSTATNANNAGPAAFWGPQEQDGDYAIRATNTTGANELLTLTFTETGSPASANVGIFGVTAAVPEPSTVGLIAAAGGAFSCRRRRSAAV